MYIPAWVEKDKRSQSAKRTARLKFIINGLAARFTSRGSIRAFGLFVGVDHSTISGYIRKGEFSEAAAKTIIAKVGDPTLTVEMLTDPLSIPKEPS